MNNPEEASRKTWSAPTIVDLNTKSNEGGKSYNDHEASSPGGAVVGPS